MSLRKKIILSICFTLILMMVILSSLIYSKSATILNKTATLQMQSQLERAKENIDLRLQITKLETEKLALDENALLFCQGQRSSDEMNPYLIDKMAVMDQGEGYYKDLFIMDLSGVIRATTMVEAQDIDLSSRAYLKASQDTLETVTSDALIARSDGSLIVNTVSPIFNSKEEVIGYAGIAIKAAYFSKIVSDLKLGDEGYYGIVDSNYRILAHPNPELIYKEFPYEISILLKRPKGSDVYNGPSIFNKNENAFQSYEYIESNKWYLIATLPERELYSQSILLLSYVIIAGSIGILVAIGMGYYMGNQITKPIIAITKTLENLTSSRQLIDTAVDASIVHMEAIDLANISDQSTWNKLQLDLLKGQTIKRTGEDEIGNLRSAIYALKEYLSSMSGFFEKESEKLMHESRQVTQSINSMSFNTARFIATLSHDLKTSITLIKGYAKGLNTGIIKDEETKEKFLNGILSSAEDIENITCDILDHAYEAQCVPKLKKEWVSAKIFSEELISSTASFLLEKNRRFSNQVDDFENEMLNIDVVKIKRVWQNLINNAVKYSKAHSNIECHITYDTMNKCIKLEVRDQGIGIKKSHLSSLQEMFYRAECDETKGYGLGLFIARSILEAHDSKLEIDSIWGEGTTMSFYLQLYDNIELSIDVSETKC